jgi:hypothetical protein
MLSMLKAFFTWFFVLISFILINACGFFEEANFLNPGSRSGIAWWNEDWEYRRQLTFNNSGQAEDLSDFPVLITLNSSRINYSYTQDNGEDLRFIDADGSTVLSYEIETWNESGESIVWVKVPLIDGSSASDYIMMYYGNNGAAGGENAAAVWSNNYEAVLHLAESSGDFIDSTGNGYYAREGDNANTDIIRQATGMAGYGLEFDGDYDYLALNMSYSGTGALNSLTLCVWFRTSDNSAGAYNDNWAFIDFDRSEFYDFYVCVDAGGATDGSIGFSTTHNGATNDFYGSSTGLYDNSWHFAGAVFNGGTSTKLIYLDGNQDGSTNQANDIGNATTRWGLVGDGSEATGFAVPYTAGYHNTCWYSGFLDELRISHTVRSADWIAAQYASMNDTFIGFGNEEN